MATTTFRCQTSLYEIRTPHTFTILNILYSSELFLEYVHAKTMQWYTGAGTRGTPRVHFVLYFFLQETVLEQTSLMQPFPNYSFKTKTPAKVAADWTKKTLALLLGIYQSIQANYRQSVIIMKYFQFFLM